MQPNLEDRLADEIERQGVRVSPAGFRQMLTECIGRVDANSFIGLEHGSISLPDYVRSCRQAHPELFGSASNQAGKPSGNLTEQMRQEIAQTRSRSLPSDWSTVRNRYAGQDNLTAAMMDERAAARQKQ